MREKNIHRFRITNHFKLFNQNSYRQEYRNIYYAKYCGRGGGEGAGGKIMFVMKYEKKGENGIVPGRVEEELDLSGEKLYVDLLGRPFGRTTAHRDLKQNNKCL